MTLKKLNHGKLAYLLLVVLLLTYLGFIIQARSEFQNGLFAILVTLGMVALALLVKGYIHMKINKSENTE